MLEVILHYIAFCPLFDNGSNDNHTEELNVREYNSLNIFHRGHIFALNVKYQKKGSSSRVNFLLLSFSIDSTLDKKYLSELFAIIQAITQFFRGNK